MFIGIFGVFGVLSGAKLVSGALGAIWGYLAAAGAYELNRRKFDWTRGRQYRDQHLLAGTIAASTGLAVSGALHETMPGLVILPVLSAILQANDGHKKKYLAAVHALLLAAGIATAIWLYADGVTGKVWLEQLEQMP